MYHSDHHSHLDPAFELVESDCHQCGEHTTPNFYIECSHLHKIYQVNITHLPGDFIYWDSAIGAYVPAVENKCDLMVLRVDPYGTWFEAANVGEFRLKNFTLKGPVYIDYTGELTNTKTNTKIGFIESGNLYLSIQTTSEYIGVYNLNGLVITPAESIPQNLVNGQIITTSDGLYIQINNILYKVDLTAS